MNKEMLDFAMATAQIAIEKITQKEEEAAGESLSFLSPSAHLQPHSLTPWRLLDAHSRNHQLPCP